MAVLSSASGLAAAEALVAYELCLSGFLVLLASDTHEFCRSHDLSSLLHWASHLLWKGLLLTTAPL